MYDTFYPEPRDRNLVSPSKVFSSCGTYGLAQDEVELRLYNPLLRSFFEEITDRSLESTKYLGVEVGFFAIITDQDPVVSFVTSNETDRIHSEDLDVAFKRCSDQLNASTKVHRVQFYHTHPAEPCARTISRLDVNYAIKSSKEIPQRIGHPIPFDMHALPIELSRNGAVTYWIKPPLGKPTPPECKVPQKKEHRLVLLRATV